MTHPPPARMSRDPEYIARVIDHTKGGQDNEGLYTLGDLLNIGHCNEPLYDHCERDEDGTGREQCFWHEQGITYRDALEILIARLIYTEDPA